jgi:hypothetical protein
MGRGGKCAVSVIATRHSQAGDEREEGGRGGCDPCLREDRTMQPGELVLRRGDGEEGKMDGHL